MVGRCQPNTKYLFNPPLWHARLTAGGQSDSFYAPHASLCTMQRGGGQGRDFSQMIWGHFLLALVTKSAGSFSLFPVSINCPSRPVPYSATFQFDLPAGKSWSNKMKMIWNLRVAPVIGVPSHFLFKQISFHRSIVVLVWQMASCIPLAALVFSPLQHVVVNEISFHEDRLYYRLVLLNRNKLNLQLPCTHEPWYLFLQHFLSN